MQAYYSKQPKHNYWIGCSSGGKQGLKEVQAYPDEFDVLCHLHLSNASLH